MGPTDVLVRRRRREETRGTRSVEPLGRRHRAVVERMLEDPPLARVASPGLLEATSVAAWLDELETSRLEGRVHRFVVREHGAVVAGCGLSVLGGPSQRQLSYWVLPSARERGLGHHVARFALNYAVTRLATTRVITWVAADNLASKAILRRLGLRLRARERTREVWSTAWPTKGNDGMEL